jgi:3-hydroxybutyryl-CoA dehydrogenase
VIINEAALVVGEEIVPADELDATLRQVTRFPRGPLEWAERIGRHTCAALLRRLNERVDDGRFQAADWLTA